MRIEVTAGDVAEGVPNDCGACPVGRALRRALGVEVWVDPAFIRRPGRPGRIRTPEPAALFVEAFDRGERPGAFAFDLAEGDARELTGRTPEGRLFD